MGKDANGSRLAAVRVFVPEVAAVAAGILPVMWPTLKLGLRSCA